ncbi:MAG TPA: DUF1501 domain-containing protein [Prosthecobacter sp.]|nr:DUF1501 domain-containing protein [Prosthecobacter sp.]
MTSLTRRRFLGHSGCSLAGSVPILNTLLNLRLAGQAAAQQAPSDYRSIVCLFLNGGNDSFNWLVPRDPARHATYSTTRSDLALPLGDLRALNQAGGDGQLYGIHPGCAGLQDLFNGLGGDTAKRRAAFIANIGTLIQPVTKAQYLAESVPLPRALYSHADQIDQWQTSVPQGMAQLSGWAGRAADVIHSTANANSIAMNISLAGNNLFQVGNTTTQFVVTDRGALTFTGSEISDPLNPLRLKNTAHRSIIEQNYSNLMQQSYASLTKSSIQLQEFFLQQFNNYNDSAIAGLFPPNNWVGNQFRAAAKMIALRQDLGLHRQTLFLSFGGWDHHGELLETQDGMLRLLDGALTAFQRALDQLGLQDSVITFTASDFGRTLRSNGRGTDHAWGGNALVMGGPVQGGRIYGAFPDLTLESANDTGYGGRIIPTTSVDQLFAEMLRWFGVPAADMDYVLPNIANFYNVNSATLPIGFLRPGTWV